MSPDSSSEITETIFTVFLASRQSSNLKLRIKNSILTYYISALKSKDMSELFIH